MLIVALILAVIGLAALVTAVVTGNELIAWVCIGASGFGILLLIVDAIRDRARRRTDFPAAVTTATEAETTEVIEPVETTEVIEPVVDAVDTVDDEDVLDDDDVDDDVVDDESDSGTETFVSDDESELAEEDHPEELVHDDPDYDDPGDDEADFPAPAEEAAVHIVSESDIDAFDDVEEAAEDSAVEMRYVPGAEDSGISVVYTQADSAEPVETEEREDHRDQ